MCHKIDAYEDGELTGEERIRFEKHLESCPSCRKELEWLESLNIMFSKMPARRPPRGIEWGVLSAIGFERKPVWSSALGWTTSSIVGAWLVALVFLVRGAGLKSIVPAAKGLAGIPSILSGLLHGLHVAVDILGPLNTTMTALAKTAGHIQFPAIMATMLLIGLVAGFGIWINIRGVRYARSYV